MSWVRSVYSKRASSIAYDSETEEMVVTWSDGKSTVYSGVPEYHADELSRAASVGSMINNEFTGCYEHRNIK